MTGGPEDRRTSARRALIRAARSTFDGPQSPIECVLLDISPGGARLRVHRINEFPERFTLHVESEGLARVGRVVWRKDDEVGVQFEDA